MFLPEIFKHQVTDFFPLASMYCWSSSLHLTAEYRHINRRIRLIFFLFFVLFCFVLFFVFLPFLGWHPQHMEIPRLGV